eukprot:209595-Lingulodinium_polyedra.AAC.1
MPHVVLRQPILRASSPLTHLSRATIGRTPLESSSPSAASVVLAAPASVAGAEGERALVSVKEL